MTSPWPFGAAELPLFSAGSWQKETAALRASRASSVRVCLAGWVKVVPSNCQSNASALHPLDSDTWAGVVSVSDRRIFLIKSDLIDRRGAIPFSAGESDVS